MTSAGSELDLDQLCFAKSERKKGNTSKKKLVIDFINHVEETLNPHTSIHKLDLRVQFSRLNRRKGDLYVNEWLNHAFNSNLKHLWLSYLTTSGLERLEKPTSFALPDTLYRYAALETMNLFRCRFTKPVLGVEIALSLKELMLYKVTVDADTLQKIVRSCSASLEKLGIELCHGFDAVRVDAGEKLETVELYLDTYKKEIVAIWAPNVRRLNCGGGLDNVQESFLASGQFDKVEELKLHDVRLLGQKSLQLIQKLPTLQKLQLRNCGTGFDFLQLPALQKLQFQNCGGFDCLQLNREEIMSLVESFDAWSRFVMASHVFFILPKF